MKSSLVIFFLFCLYTGGLAQSQNQLLDEYFSAAPGDQKKKAVKRIIASKLSFNEVFHQLNEGKHYSTKVKRGFFELKQEGERLPPAALILVPYDYSPQKKYSLRVFLHRAVSNRDPQFVYHMIDTLNEAYRKTQSITIYPSAWMWAPWWSDAQYENINRLVDQVKQQYNVNENDIRLGGVSDGGTGSFYLANCNMTVWSCITPFIGFEKLVDVLPVRTIYSNNFRNSSFYVVNTAKDHLFPIQKVIPYHQLLRRINPTAVTTIVDSSGHNLRWLPVLRDSIDQYALKHQRNPFPDKLSWTTDSGLKYNRFRYVIINQLGSVKPDKMGDEFNEIVVDGKKQNAHKRDSVYGNIEVETTGNTVKVKASNIKKYTLLISPSQFDLSKPIIVWTNENKSFEGLVQSDIKTLLKWNLIDNDRTSLYAAEVQIPVK
ncbi:MAG TPA: hypothetical protein VIT44_09230 [Cyclobacteriaceae bacterium]